jgi:hypothetical protein
LRLIERGEAVTSAIAKQAVAPGLAEEGRTLSYTDVTLPPLP